jgi:hypothetical protein
MPTLDDLRATFQQLENRAPTELAYPLSERPARTRDLAHNRPFLSGLAVAATVAAVAVGVVVVRHHSDDQHRPAAPAPSCAPPRCPLHDQHGRAIKVPTTYTMAPKPGSGWTATALIAGYNEQGMVMDKGATRVDVDRYDTAADAPKYTSHEAVTIDGHQANFASFAADSPKRGIVWSENGHIVVVRLDPITYPDTEPSARAIDARTLPAARRRAVTLPFRFNKLPNGLVPQKVTWSNLAAPDVPTMALVDFTDGKPSPTPGTGVVEVSVSNSLDTTESKLSSEKVNGHPVYLGNGFAPGQIQVPISAKKVLYLQVGPDMFAKKATAQALEIARHMTLAPDVAKPATWFTEGWFPTG